MELDQVSNNFLKTNLYLLPISKIRYRYHSLFFEFLLLLSGDVHPNPGPLDTNLNKMWEPFKKRGLHFIHININSLLPKIEELRSIALKSNVAIIGITESKLDDSVSNSEIDIDNYTLIRCDRNRHGGGVACYIRDDINFTQKSIFDSEIENIFIDVLLPKTKPFTVGIFYRPPNKTNFIDKIINDFSKLNSENNDLFILGDMNINLSQNGKYILDKNNNDKTACPQFKKYKEFINNFGLKQLIRHPTRITCSTSSLIDHILTNAKEKISQSGIIDIGLSDHQMIFCTRKVTKIKIGMPKYINFRSMKNYSKELFNDKLQNINFPNYENFQDTNLAYSDFINKLTGVINSIAPMKQRKMKNNSQEWYDGEVAEKIAIRDKLFKKFKKSKLNVDKDLFKEARNNVESLIKNKKKTFFENKLKENIGKPKELWKTLNDLGLAKKGSSSGKQNICLKENDNFVFDPVETSNIFKTFFSDIAKNLLSKLPIAPNRFNKNSVLEYYKNLQVTKNFQFSQITDATIFEILKNLDVSKSAGNDNITAIFLKDGAEYLASPIAQLCNLSISTSTFPDNCKSAKVLPLYKKGSKTDPKNYRPISLLPLISKIIEKVIHDQTQSFLDENKILYSFQSGFRKKYSTDSCLSFLNNKISKGFDAGLYTGLILIDLQKAFDTIDHEILLEKMIAIGFSNKVIDWYRSYLSNRKFNVNVNKTLSTSGEITCGVPQGSILGPLLFLLYVNDMPQAVSCDLLLYADDSCLIYQHKDVKEIEQMLNKNFSDLCDWFVDNKLSIHFGDDKTKCILFASKNKVKKAEPLNINYNGIEIKQHSKVNYLGCIFDDSLSGESMGLHVLNKLNSKLKFLYRKNRCLPPSLRRLLCNAIIQPHFDYACAAWFPNLNQGLKKKLQTFQNKCIRFCLQLGNRTHIGVDEFREINWLNVTDRFNQCVSASVFKHFNNISPTYMAEIFNPISRNVIGTRNSFLKLTQPSRRTKQGQNCLSFIGPSIWNKLPERIKDSNNLNSFKHKVKEHFLNENERRENNIYTY